MNKLFAANDASVDDAQRLREQVKGASEILRAVQAAVLVSVRPDVREQILDRVGSDVSMTATMMLNTDFADLQTAPYVRANLNDDLVRRMSHEAQKALTALESGSDRELSRVLSDLGNVGNGLATMFGQMGAVKAKQAMTQFASGWLEAGSRQDAPSAHARYAAMVPLRADEAAPALTRATDPFSVIDSLVENFETVHATRGRMSARTRLQVESSINALKAFRSQEARLPVEAKAMLRRAEPVLHLAMRDVESSAFGYRDRIDAAKPLRMMISLVGTVVMPDCMRVVPPPTAHVPETPQMALTMAYDLLDHLRSDLTCINNPRVVKDVKKALDRADQGLSNVDRAYMCDGGDAVMAAKTARFLMNIVDDVSGRLGKIEDTVGVDAPHDRTLPIHLRHFCNRALMATEDAENEARRVTQVAAKKPTLLQRMFA